MYDKLNVIVILMKLVIKLMIVTMIIVYLMEITTEIVLMLCSSCLTTFSRNFKTRRQLTYDRVTVSYLLYVQCKSKTENLITVLRYVLFCLTYMYCTLYVLYLKHIFLYKYMSGIGDN